ncbi:hypothetical protein TNCV_2556111 [Trichonephila clavipes]|nr:hypothetical protein TNCV_2556111 [Trichonephila clavipes]
MDELETDVCTKFIHCRASHYIAGQDINTKTQSRERAVCVWLVTLTAVPLGLGSNPGEEGMDVCKRIVPLVGLVEEEERWEAPDHKIGMEPSKTVLTKAKTNDIRKKSRP